MQYGSDARKARLNLARQSRQHVAELKATLLDPDLSDDAKARRTVPIRQKIREVGERIQRDVPGIVAAAREAALAVRPAAIRRHAAFKHAEKTAAARAAVQGLSPAELLEWARLSTRERDSVAGYAIAMEVSDLHGKADATALSAVISELDSAQTLATKASRADLIVAQAEALRLEHDINTLTKGGPFDPAALLSVANASAVLELQPGVTESLTDQDINEAYALAGVEKKPPAELVELLEPPANALNILENPGAFLNKANREPAEAVPNAAA
ncbi:MAG: hypothetical protein H0U59_01655 [Gemmatimonadaceae bacterium]|nr:hypothetical protein [Gemmatimonadaceae bacterium]